MTGWRGAAVWVVSSILIIGGLVVLFSAAVDALIPSPPPAPAPHHFAHELSGLSIPATATVDTLRWDPSGRFLWARVELTLSAADMAQLVAEARARGYQDVVGGLRREERRPDSADSSGVSPPGALQAAEELPAGSPGLYRYQHSTDPSRFVLAVLDSARGRFVAEIRMP